jgi:hypothetical protein
LVEINRESTLFNNFFGSKYWDGGTSETVANADESWQKKIYKNKMEMKKNNKNV